MLKTNTKKVRESVRAFIKDHTEESFDKVYSHFLKEKDCYTEKENEPIQEIFKSWISGIPSCLDLYPDILVYDNCQETVAGWLGESPEEAKRFDCYKSFDLAIYLIFRELQRDYYKAL